jgi:hypothetical protein
MEIYLTVISNLYIGTMIWDMMYRGEEMKT